MPELEAYRRSLRPHSHAWLPLDDEDLDSPDWCMGCGAVRWPDGETIPGCPIWDSGH